MVWYFIGVYIINRTLHGDLEIWNFSSRVEKYFTRSLRSLVKYYSPFEETLRISARPCNILDLKGHVVCLNKSLAGVASVSAWVRRESWDESTKKKNQANKSFVALLYLYWTLYWKQLSMALFQNFLPHLFLITRLSLSYLFSCYWLLPNQ